MRVGLITSVPLVPPWDQGDKNLAYALTGALPHVQFGVLTTCDGPRPRGANLVRHPLYRDMQPSLAQKMNVYRWLLSSTNGSSPDLYHLVYQPSALSSRFIKWLPELRRRPAVHTVPATTQGHGLNASLFYADRVVSLSQHGQRTLARAGLKNVVHIPPGIPFDGWAALVGQSEQLKSSLDLSGKLVLLYPGHFSPGYGLGDLVQALPYIHSKVPELRVVLACRVRSREDEREENAVRERINSLGLGHAVQFHRTVGDMRALVGASDLVVAPFKTMRNKVDIPTSLLEALAAGKPIVISDIPPMNELVSNKGADLGLGSVGLTVPPGDADALASAAVTLLADDELRSQMGQHGQALVRERFDIRQVARRYEALYRDLV
jgi:glycosyltransferase involved in cell wall biosynthesis